MKLNSPLPPRMRALPIDPVRDVPVPWFVAWVDGKPEWRAADEQKLVKAIKERRCWVCGEVLGRYLTFVLGPMCGINRISAEPPCHKDCAEFSAQNCPFLLKPAMERRTDEALEKLPIQDAPGVMLKRNPGVTLLWTTRTYRLVNAGRGVLFKIGDPEETFWWCQGRAATRAEIMASVESGLPLLQESCAGPDDLKTLSEMKEKFMPLVPA